MNHVFEYKDNKTKSVAYVGLDLIPTKLERAWNHLRKRSETTE